MKSSPHEWLRCVCLLILSQTVLSMVLLNSTDLSALLEKYMDEDGDGWQAKQRGKRAISQSDMQAILDLHNKLRGQVYPQSSNMEHMVWDTELERSAEEWAETCLWEHGPAGLLPQIGQNLGVHWGRYRPPTSHVQAWYDEVRDYSFPYPQECNPYCPFRCSGPVCTHYTQLVWATSNRIGCAINLCYDMNVWGQIWSKAVYLVCNYSPKGNWWGHSPYKHGTPCSACPPSYGGGCRDNLCYKDDGTSRRVPSEDREENNSIEPEPQPQPQQPQPEPQPQPRQQPLPTRTPTVELDRNEVVSTQQMSQLVNCDTKLRDQCKGTPCNRYECPAGCLDSTGKVVGTVYYEMQSSICRAGLHYGVIDNDGGWMDVSRQGRQEFFIKSLKNGVQSLGKYQSANAFTVSKVTVKVVTCETTVAQLCPYQRPAKHCPRIYCPRNCMQENPQISRVIGTGIYSDKSSICRAAVHAGVIKNASGGYIDVMSVDKRRQYIASYQNGIFSESLQNPPGAKAFRVFAVI
ncbi:cysteine-rich secretory protein LCCL domain-containing 1 [Alosa sapidissima]|uniref:cysteine-rich secretory protein LCCL domain-containing 1 n=1 Tax=Alosa sapidissima TaxID=34773 RepID=UPI001C096493|nr:cysteine-rich secretory protein LCCL domain-containing 1 [Alosa sapidissima]XP_041924401.1 cysteine-rich secretory protein LCCL domain-containing 1 [Alosa sapidissima]